VISSIGILVFFVFWCYLAEDFFFAKSIQVISSISIQVFFVFWSYLAEDFFFAKSIQVISSLSSGATWPRTSSLPKFSGD
jgi:hypothetical protein